MKLSSPVGHCQRISVLFLQVLLELLLWNSAWQHGHLQIDAFMKFRSARLQTDIANGGYCCQCGAGVMSVQASNTLPAAAPPAWAHP